MSAAANDEQHRPEFAPILDRIAYVGEQLEFVIRARDRDGDALVIRGKQLPEGAQVTDRGDGSAVFRWRPEPGQAGRHYPKFSASERQKPTRRDVEGMRITVIEGKGDPTAGRVSARWIAEKRRIDIQGRGSAKGRTVVLKDSASRYVGKTVADRYGAWRFAKSLASNAVPCRIGVTVQGKTTVRRVDGAPRNCIKGDSEARVTDAHWRASVSQLRVKGDLAPIDAQVQIVDAETGETIATTSARRTGRFSYRDNIAIPPCKVLVKIDGMTSAAVEVADAAIACRMIAAATSEENDGADVGNDGGNDDEGGGNEGASGGNDSSANDGAADNADDGNGAGDGDDAGAGDESAGGDDGNVNGNNAGEGSNDEGQGNDVGADDGSAPSEDGNGNDGGSANDDADSGISSASNDTGAAGGDDERAAGLTAFSQTVYPIVRQRCVGCHSGRGPGSPSIAHTETEAAYSAVVDSQKVNLGTPFGSRLVQRLASDGHHCWGDCTANADQMKMAISEWAAMVGFDPGAVANSGIVSASVSLADSSEGTTSARYDTQAIALYEFSEGTGRVARDTSGVAPALDLELSGTTAWADGGGLSITSGKAAGSSAASRKLYDVIAAEGGTNEYSVELWVSPGNSTQGGPARIASYSRGTGVRNFTVGQAQGNYVFRNRSAASGIDNNGLPELVAEQTVVESSQHVVMTFDQRNGRRIYVNGELIRATDANGPGSLSRWRPDYIFLLGNETSDDRQWQGVIRFAAVHKRALNARQVAQNFAAGVGQKYRLSFDLTRWTGAPSSVEFEVSEFDSFSYLFATPVFKGPIGVRVQDLRVGINGVVPAAGQSFREIDLVTDSQNQTLSRRGAVIAKDRGANVDVFSLSFNRLNTYTSTLVEPNSPAPPKVYSGPERPELGLRDFDQLNSTMAVLTGVNPMSVRDTFKELEQQLPSTFDVQTFVSAHQVAVFKLALEYCDNMIESPRLRDAFFGPDPDYDEDFIDGVAFDFDAPADIAFSDPAASEALSERLIKRMIGNGLESQPAEDEVSMVLSTLTDALVDGCGATGCGVARTRTVVKAACAAVLSSAPVLLY